MKSLVQYIIEAQSKPTIEWMEEHYKKYNEELFNNELPSKIRLGLISKKSNALGWQGFDKVFYTWQHKMKDGMYICYYIKPEKSDIEEKILARKVRAGFSESVYNEVNNCEELQPYIELNPKYKFSDFQKEDTLIHEMIHLWVSRNGLFPKQAHGKEFRKKCNEIREKAKELYGIEYELTTYASHQSEEDKSWSVDKEVQNTVENDIVKASKRGGGIVSVYMVFDKDKMANETDFDRQLQQYTKRFFFCTKSMLPKFIHKIVNQQGLKDVYISTASYVPFAERFGKMKTINKWGVIWDATEFDENLFIEGAETHNTYNESLSINEGLVSKLKAIVKKIMNVFVRIDKSTPSSEIDMEKMLNYAEEVEELDSDQNGSDKNNKKMIEI